VVSPGETLLVIANEYDVKVDDIVKANNLSSAQFIRVGQKLIIPEGYVPPTPTPKATAWALNYIVQEGDSLDYIALSFHVPLPTLVAANHFTSTVIHPGDVVIVPQGKPPKELTPTPISGPLLLPTPPTEQGVRLLYPPDGARLSEGPLVLRWLAASWLSKDEWYRLRVWKDGDEKPAVELLTRATGWHMDESLKGSKPIRWRWRVEVVESLVPDGTPTPERTPREGSPLWSFQW
jgi:LysM repeat protein